MKKIIITSWILLLLIYFSSVKKIEAALIINHNHIDINKIPDYWLEQAKNRLRIGYEHTSHGGQSVTGMRMLRSENVSLFSFSQGYSAGSTSFLCDGCISPSVGDLGNPNRTAWYQATRDYLNGAGSVSNVIIWAWCGQVSNATQADIDNYLNMMNQLENEFPNVQFIYMTGHLDGSGPNGNLHQRNEQIRQYVINNNKILYDFADIERYDPAGRDYLGLGGGFNGDGCSYNSGNTNWCTNWCRTNVCVSCGENRCSHDDSSGTCLNCYMKGKAFWWMMARLAGWDGGNGVNPSPTGSGCQVSNGDTNGNGIDMQDLITWYQSYKGDYNVGTDFDCNGKIDIQDLLIWYINFKR